jgi:abortive infection bacteriophage resistance protein
MQFNKKPLSVSDQISLLESRGLIVENKPEAEHFLSNVSYYRLRAYMMPFQKENDTAHIFLPNITFHAVVDLYIF